MMDRIPCKRCLGKGVAKIAETGMSVSCPDCNGTGYEGGIPHTTRIPALPDEPVQVPMESKQISVEQQEIIFKQLIKYPELFIDRGLHLNYADENPEIFIYLKNNFLFTIKQTDTYLHIILKPEYRNNLAFKTIQYMKENNYENQ